MIYKKNSRPIKLQIIIIVSLFFCFFVSFPLWTNDRLFPVLPVLDFLVTGGWVHFCFLSILFFSGLLSILDFKFSTHSLVLFLSFLVIFCLQDQNRWQPWVYIFFVLLCFIFLHRLQVFTEKSLLTLFRISFIGIYTWSGLHKLNAGFISEILPQLPVPELGVLGYSIPLMEALMGIGLILVSTRKFSVFLLLAMHFLILFEVILGSFTYNTIIIPWNLGMMVLLVLLFWNKETIHIISNQYLTKGLAILLFLILPAGNFFDLWPGYPSFNLFSGKNDRAFLYVDETFKSNFKEKTHLKFDEENKISVHSYSYSELNVPFYSERDAYISLFNTLCTRSEHEFSIVMEIQTLPSLLNNEWETESFFCDQFR